MAVSTSDEGLPALTRVTVRPPFAAYLKQLWHRRHFIRLQSSSMALSRHQGTLLGNIWLILRPILDGLVYFVIFGLLLGQRGAVDNYLGFLMVGVFLFSFTSRSVTQGVGVIASNRGLIRAFTFPRAALPLALITRELVEMVPVLGALAILLMTIAQVLPTWHWLMLIPLLAIQAVFNLGMVLILGRLGFMVPDLRTLVPYLVRFWFYGSAVMIPITVLDGKYPLDVIGRANPMFIVLDTARASLVYQQVAPLGQWLTLLAWAFGVLVVGFLFFYSAEESYGKQQR